VSGAAAHLHSPAHVRKCREHQSHTSVSSASIMHMTVVCISKARTRTTSATLPTQTRTCTTRRCCSAATGAGTATSPSCPRPRRPNMPAPTAQTLPPAVRMRECTLPAATARGRYVDEPHGPAAHMGVFSGVALASDRWRSNIGCSIVRRAARLRCLQASHTHNRWRVASHHVTLWITRHVTSRHETSRARK
jgi:hypothetical protein